MLIFICRSPQNIPGLWYPYYRRGKVSGIHLTLSYDSSNDRNNIGGWGGTLVFLFIFWHGHPWHWSLGSKKVCFPLWAVVCLWFLPPCPLFAFLFPGRLTSVDCISRHSCPLASGLIWLMGAFTGGPRERGKKDQGVYYLQGDCIP